eukprot:352385-Chlamydomonas_euryale.AAC.6
MRPHLYCTASCAHTGPTQDARSYFDYPESTSALVQRLADMQVCAHAGQGSGVYKGWGGAKRVAGGHGGGRACGARERVSSSTTTPSLGVCVSGVLVNLTSPSLLSLTLFPHPPTHTHTQTTTRMCPV